MHTDSTGLTLSATDLANHLACRHLTELDHRVAHGLLSKPDWRDPSLDLLRERGLRHEQAYVEHLRALGRNVVDLSVIEGDDRFARTAAAMREGADVIVQAALRHGRWLGYADILERVEGDSDLGAWSYDVLDTKLAQETRGGTVLQLCLYADLLAAIQGRPAELMHVVKPGDGFPRETFRFDEYAAYYRWVRRRLEAFVDRQAAAGVTTAAAGRQAGDDPAATLHYPEPVPHCDICRWWGRCDGRRHDDDHLSLVAGLATVHATELRRQGTGTLEAFATSPEPLAEPPQRGARETYAGLQHQATVQLEGRRRDAPYYELLPVEAERGLARLPEPCPGDVYLDFEGDPFVEGGGLEYLLGYAYRDDAGRLQYTGLWALDKAAEKRAFEAFVDFLRARLEQHPGLHVYHYAPYEPAALKRLASRHATRESELDVLLRAERFVDLYAVVRQGLRASVESYSLKPLEAFFGYERQVDLREEASPALRRVSCALELGMPDEVTADDRRAVEGYNKDDCLSLVALQPWLEERRAELIARGETVPRPPLKDGAASEGQEARDADIQALFERLIDGLLEDPAERTAEHHARWLLAHMLEYFHRENRVGWWEYFARREADHETRRADRKCIVGLQFVEDLGTTGRRGTVPTHRYAFPREQEVSLDEGDQVDDLDTLADDPARLGTVTAIDLQAGTIDIKKMKLTKDRHPAAIHARDDVPTQPVDGSLIAVARAVADHGLTGAAVPHPAACRLLLREPPMGAATAAADLVRPDESPLEAGLRVAAALDGGVLAIQGPPGAGKSHNGSRMVVGLARAGKRVGISATSHKVIRNLLEKVLEAAAEQGVSLRVVHKISSRGDPPAPVAGLEDVRKGDEACDAVRDGAVTGGVAWTWASDDFEQSLDYLFIDEAGQMSLAHVLACARAARNLVMLGDPLQLQQPQRGAHPEGAEISALDHLLGKHKTMPPDLGLFLEETWRLPPAICGFTSEVFYEGRLTPREGRERQVLVDAGPFAGAGLFVVPVPHEGNQNASDEEVEAVAGIVGTLLAGPARWVDATGATKPLRPTKDILIVAPYNAHVAALKRRLPDLRIGTVDRFQGQQAPVVIYSMASSSPQDAPRGMAFLYDLHRLNVATSRAQCACILVASPALFEPECRTPEQIRWASGLCRYRELGRVVSLQGLPAVRAGTG